jgi:hypothetical protein
MNKILKKMLVLSLILLSIFLIYFFKFNKTQNKYTENISGVPALNKITLIGVIRDSGLRQEEADALNIPLPRYQITDLTNKSFKYKEIEFNGAYLNESNLEISKNIGRCVEITGVDTEINTLVTSDYMVNGQYTYNRMVLSPLKLKILNNKFCNVYTFNESSLTNLKKVTLEGKITRFTRPAPDIGYDYQIILKEPFTDENNASGLPQTVNSCLIVPISDEIWKKIEGSIKGDKDNLTLEGYENWGYAESKYILVTSIK